MLSRTTLGLVRVINVKINANARAMTIEELHARRKSVAVNMGETLGRDAVRFVTEIQETSPFQVVSGVLHLA